ncbi:MAG: hypothetical protein QM784_07760 [Polyangiaceae bacterium]
MGLSSNPMFWLVLVAGLAFAVVYLMFFLREVPGAAEERLGKLEPLPEDLGVWRRDTDSADGVAAASSGLVREERLILDDPSGTGGGSLLRQVRYRDVTSGVIARAEPDERIRRRRIFPA